MWTSRKCPNHPCPTVLFPCIPLILKKRKEDDPDTKRKKEGVNVVIPFVPSADNSNLSADGEDSFISVDMDSAMPSPFSEVRMYETLLVCTSWLDWTLWSWIAEVMVSGRIIVQCLSCNDISLADESTKQSCENFPKEWMISIELLCHCQHTSSHLLATLISCRSSYSSSIFWSCCLSFVVLSLCPCLTPRTMCPCRSRWAVSSSPAPFLQTKAAATCW